MKKYSIGQIFLHLFLLMFVIAAIIPFLNMITVSLIPNSYILPTKPQILPESFKAISFVNYKKVWGRESFGRYFLNSVFVSSMATILTMFVSTLSAYGFARLNFKGKKIIFNLYVFSLMMPAVLAIISQFTVLQKLKLINTYTGLILLYVSGGVAGNTFFLKGFFETIPKELEESVIMDGGSRWTIYRHIILPLSKPALGTLAIGVFTGTWMEVFTALVVLTSKSKRTLPIAMKLLQNGRATEWGLIFAGSIIVLIPILIIFIIFNKQFIKRSGAEGAVKG
ncbi:carbohydrate ABC transporter membrane protein 2, CUT1 family [Caloramator quimbayensis]|uniref:Carbohydrate ABC transporter membrane protein 2, CUT1 family n=1 Tax=Caloramator quimbayensis TaxID=1147123 RepID=A0A1T4XV72_9CLOT|nr:carbohydrate ABC transporter permease [Caloramator quimbayensis]SKA93068.1 carbohydrate ABC transporter membrane protein 2, CUT1 family [Caloramator quimbayensis]